MIEAGFPNLPHLEFANNMAAIRTISRDLTNQTPIPTTTGSVTTALELQQRYLDAATEWLTRREETGGTTNTELTHTLNLWRTTLNAIKTGDITTIDHNIIRLVESFGAPGRPASKIGRASCRERV